MREIKFIQICADQYRVYALDEAGEIWWHHGVYYNQDVRKVDWQKLHIEDGEKQKEILSQSFIE